MDELLTIKEVAKKLRVTEKTVRLNIQQGKIPSIKVCGSRRVKNTDLEALLGK